MKRPIILIAIAVLTAAPARAGSAPTADQIKEDCRQGRSDRMSELAEALHTSIEAVRNPKFFDQVVQDKCSHSMGKGYCENAIRKILNSTAEANQKLNDACSVAINAFKGGGCTGEQAECAEKAKDMLKTAGEKYRLALKILEDSKKEIERYADENEKVIADIDNQLKNPKLSEEDRKKATEMRSDFDFARSSSETYATKSVPKFIQDLKDGSKKYAGSADKLGHTDFGAPKPNGPSTITGKTDGAPSPAAPNSQPATPQPLPAPSSTFAGRSQEGTQVGLPPPDGKVPPPDSKLPPAPNPVSRNASNTPAQAADDDPFKSAFGSIATTIPLAARVPPPAPSPNQPIAAPPGIGKPGPAEEKTSGASGASGASGEKEDSSQVLTAHREEKTAPPKTAAAAVEEAASPTLFSGHLGAPASPQADGRATAVMNEYSYSSRAPASAASSFGFSTYESPAQAESGRAALANPAVKQFVDKEVTRLEKDHPLTDSLRETLRRKLASRMADRMEETRLKNAVDKGASGALAAVFGASTAPKETPGEAEIENAFRLGASETDAEVKRLLGHESEEKLSEIPGAYSLQTLFERVHSAHTRFAKR